MKKITRRNFFTTSLFSAATIGWTARSWAQVAGANERINIATVGFNGRGGAHIGGFRALAPEGVRYVALCDVDQKVLDKGVDSFKRHNEDVKAFKDIRKLLEMKGLDAVSIATPNHWHALGAIWAIQAGKDVYVEKPVSNCVWEGRKIVEAARKYNRIVQTGTQGRSSTAIKQAVEFAHSGALGKIKLVRGLCYKRRDTIGKHDGPQTVPDHIDYNLWSGPAPLRPSNRNGKFGPVHYDWHWFWDYGCGDLGNQGIHQMDISRWFLGVDHLSPRVFSVGGRVGYKDDAETPNTQIVYHDYPEIPLIFEVRGLPAKPAGIGPDGKKEKERMDEYKGHKNASIAVIAECEGGDVVATSNYKASQVYDKSGQLIKEFKGETDHFDNFIQAMKSRNYKDLHADIWEGHLSSALCHTGNISYRVGKQAAPGEIRETLKGSKLAMEAFDRMNSHLKANAVDINSEKLTLGVFLEMDPKVERFFGNKAANKLLRREYRQPFVVPDQV
ncbi:MAG: Gfo/Idh/MocA family oxidoreductase [Pedosphaera parvula]|nr:Gfo/Idh/MocA family oxidoreductase [Pedosphaera parvula]